MKVRVSVLITAHDAATTIGATLRALAKQRVPDAVTMDVIVIDDRSHDDTSRVAREAGASVGLRLTVSRRTHHAATDCTARQAALDEALALTDASFILLLDADAVVSPTWIATMLTFLARFDVVSSPIRFVPRGDTRAESWLAALQSADAAYYAAIARVVTWTRQPAGLCFGGVGIRRSALESIGCFSALGYSLAEDLLFARVAHANGESLGFARGDVVTVDGAPSWRSLRARALRVSAVGGPSLLAAALAVPVATLPFLTALAIAGALPWWVVGARWALGSGALIYAMGANASRRVWPAALVYEWSATIAAIVVAWDAHRKREVVWGGIAYPRGSRIASTTMGGGR